MLGLLVTPTSLSPTSLTERRRSSTVSQPANAMVDNRSNIVGGSRFMPCS